MKLTNLPGRKVSNNLYESFSFDKEVHKSFLKYELSQISVKQSIRKRGGKPVDFIMEKPGKHYPRQMAKVNISSDKSS